ncbi:MAG: C1 family peptidase [Bacteroidota bacterium]
MRLFLLLHICISLVFCLCTVLPCSAQQVPVRSGKADQITPGACYIFATVAAVESLVKQKTDKMHNLSEWHYYSGCVQNGIGTGRLLMTNTLNEIQNNGAPLEEDSYAPTTLLECLSYSGFDSACYMDFNTNSSCCAEGKTFEPSGEEGICRPGSVGDSLGLAFLSSPYVPRFEMGGSTLFREIDFSDCSPNDDDCKKDKIKNVISGNVSGGAKGVITFFDEFGITYGNEIRNRDHAVFIYGYGNGFWKYKDSWQGDAGLKTNVPDSAIDFNKMTGAFYLTATITDKPLIGLPIDDDPVPNPNCESSITPNTSVSYGGSTHTNPFSDIDVCLDQRATIRVTNTEITNFCPDRLIWGISGRLGSVANASTVELIASGTTASVEILRPGAYTVWVRHRGQDNSLSPKRNIYFRYSPLLCASGIGLSVSHNKLIKVYDWYGKLVAEGGREETLGVLPEGLYIIHDLEDGVIHRREKIFISY